MKNKPSHSHGEVNIDAPPQRKMVLTIPLEQILEDPHNLREKFDEEKLKELARSIKNQGMQQSPEVNFGYKTDGTTYYFLKAGARRLRAHRLLNKQAMDCVVLCESYNGERNLERRLEQGAENSSRESQTHSELVTLVEEVVEEQRNQQFDRGYGSVGRALHHVASAFGKSDEWARNYHTLAGLLPEFRAMLDDDEEGERLNFSVGLALSRVPKDVQYAVWKESQEYFRRGGHKVGYAFIVRKSRAIRKDRGEKVRGRASDERVVFRKISEKLLDLAMSFGGGRGTHDYREWVTSNLAKMSVPDVDKMLVEMTQSIEHFSQLREMISKQRNANYSQFRKKEVA